MKLCAFAAIGGLTACGNYHVHVTGPSPRITPEERVAMFWQLRPVTEGTLKEDGNLVDRSLVLGDETRVWLPEDLEPLVGSQSETMRYARASKTARSNANTFWWLEMASFAIGLVGLGALVDGQPFGISPLWSVGVGTAGMVVSYSLNKHYVRRELELRKQAFDAYPADLGLRLNVCAHGATVIPCELPVGPPVPSSPEPPDAPATTVPDRTALRMRR